MGTIVPLEPSPHLVRQMPDRLFIGTLVQPVVVRALPVVCPSIDVAGELAFKSRDDVVELKSVGREMHPSRVSSEEAEGVAGPHAVAGAPSGNIRLSLGHVLSESKGIELPVSLTTLGLEVLLENGSPLVASDVVANVLTGLSHVELTLRHSSGSINIRLELLIRLIVSVIERSAVKVHNTSDSVQIGIGSSKSNLGTEAVTTKSSHGQLLLVHETDDIGRDLVHGETLMMVRVTHVAVVNEPDVANVEDLVVGSVEERSEVLGRFDEVSEPDHGRHVGLSASEMDTSQLDSFSISLPRGLCTS